jgi:thiamine biosynthesis lipoprotein
VRFTTWGVSGSLACEDERDLPQAEAALHRWIAAFDRSVNRFHPDSEIVRINNAPAVIHELSDTFALVLDAALTTAALTDGLVTPTVLAALEAQGYDRDYDERRATPADTHEPVAVPGLDALDYDREAHTLRLAPGCRLDFGASAKALAADLVADALEGRGVCVEIGGDVAVRARADGAPWAVGVSDTLSVSSQTPRIGLRTGGVATSSRAVRTWTTSTGTPRHHIIDPRTGTCADGPVVTASVTASSAVIANAFATAALLWGDDAAYRIAQAGWSGRLVTTTGVVDYVGGWPTERRDA